jgi:hypothetical protein
MGQISQIKENLELVLQTTRKFDKLEDFKE